MTQNHRVLVFTLDAIPPLGGGPCSVAFLCWMDFVSLIRHAESRRDISRKMQYRYFAFFRFSCTRGV